MMKLFGMLVLIGVLAIAAGEILWGPEGCTVEGAKLARVQGDDAAIANAIRTYAINAGRPPSTEQGLRALMEEPTAGSKPVRWSQIMKKVPSDPWGNPYGYRVLSEGDGWCRYEFRSVGKDRLFQTGDDWVKEIDWKR